jgi:hypothetical protein
VTRYPLFQDTREVRHRLTLVEQCFEVLYDTESSDVAWLGKLWTWLLSLNRPGLAAQASQLWAGVLGIAEAQNIPEHRRLLREQVEHFVSGAGMNQPRRLPEVNYEFGLTRAADGRAFFAVSTSLGPGTNFSALLDHVMAEVALILDGLASEAVGTCEKCTHLFVRRRAKARQYCSPRCAQQASVARKTATHKTGQPVPQRKPARRRKR